MNDWKSRLGVLYSTNPDYEYQQEEQPEEQETLAPEKQKLRLSLDKNKRRGKEVTLVQGFVGTSADLEALAKRLKQHCGVGGSAKEGEIILQGDQRAKLRELLAKWGYKIRP